MIIPVQVKKYFETFPLETQQKLNEMYKLILSIAPTAAVSISYGMPAFKLNGKPLVYFAAYTKHIGFYATPNGHEAFKKELAQYKQGKGSVQFPLHEELPIQLIQKITEYRVNQVTEKP